MKIFLFGLCFFFIGNSLAAQDPGDYRSSVLIFGNWSATGTWERYNGTDWVVATDYPGQNPGTGAVTIQNGIIGQLIVLNVSPANPIGSLAIQSGGNFNILAISDGFTLNVTGQVQINPPTGGGTVAKTISLNGAGAQLNCASLALLESTNDNWTSELSFNAGGTVNVTGDITMSASFPQRTVVRFNPTGTLNVGGNLNDGTIFTSTGIAILNNVGSLNNVTINSGTTATTSISGNLVDPIFNTGSGTLNLAGSVDNPTANPAFTGTVNFNGNGVQELIGDVTLPNMGMTSATSTLKMFGNIYVTGTLTLTAGKIDVGPNVLVLTNAAPATQLVGGSSSSYLYSSSTLGWAFIRENLAAATSYNFPVGISTNYLPVTINSAAGPSDFQVGVFSPLTNDGKPDGLAATNKLSVVDAMWNIARPVGSGSSTITIQWADALEGATFATFGDGQIGISRYAFGWLPATATSANAAANTVTATFNAFSPFGVGQLNVVLPVKFGSFEAYEKLKGIQLDWKVYSEDKVKNYEVERSADALSFNTIGSLPALYNGGSGGDYDFFDADPLPGVSFYRIKNIDLDGKSAYSQVRRVERGISVKGLSIYPNPALNNIISLRGNFLVRGNYKISIVSINGQEIYRQAINHKGGAISQAIELPLNIGKGVYLVTIIDENGKYIFSERLVKK